MYIYRRVVIVLLQQLVCWCYYAVVVTVLIDNPKKIYVGTCRYIYVKILNVCEHGRNGTDTDGKHRTHMTFCDVN